MKNSLILANTKGGTGKSLLTLNLVHGLSLFLKSKKNIYLIDLDHQGTLSNLTLKGRYKDEDGKDIGTHLKQLKSIRKDSFSQTDIDRVYFLPNNGDVDSDFFVSQVPKGYQLDALKVCLEEFDDENSIIIFDMPGSNGNNFLNILKTVSDVIIPVRLSAEDIEPIDELLQYLELNKKSNPSLSVKGIVVNQFDVSATSHNDRELKRLALKTSIPVYNSKIGHSVQYPDASGLNMTIFEYLKESEKNYINFENLTKEIINKLNLNN